MRKGLLCGDRWSELGGGLLPGVVVLLESQNKLTMSLEVNERSFARDWVVRIVENVRADVPLPFLSFSFG